MCARSRVVVLVRTGCKAWNCKDILAGLHFFQPFACFGFKLKTMLLKLCRGTKDCSMSMWVLTKWGEWGGGGCSTLSSLNFAPTHGHVCFPSPDSSPAID